MIASFSVLAHRKRQNDEILALVDRHRDHLGPYGLGLLALTYHRAGNAERGSVDHEADQKALKVEARSPYDAHGASRRVRVACLWC